MKRLGPVSWPRVTGVARNGPTKVIATLKSGREKAGTEKGGREGLTEMGTLISENAINRNFQK